ncbi:MAG: anaerobic glycerol-3-phosphate dehydrogenase subunit GlpA [Negativicutes bacterium]|nr:anaerobic glycerol-3-phosphate dehydrogenase subunit GlpA [Negativicutes bacterium]
MQKTTVVIIGGGVTGVGILRDLSLRGVKAILLERGDLAHGTSSRFHGLLHSGGRYAVTDPESARECIQENVILRKIARHCVEETEGFFVRLPEDDEGFEPRWVAACQKAGIPAHRLTPQEALRLEPNLTPRLMSVYAVPDSAVDGFRLCWQNILSARRYGGQLRTYCEVVGIERDNNQVIGVKVKDTLTGKTESLACDYIVSAAGSWVKQIAALAGIDVAVKPDRGALIAFNHRFTSRVVNRLRAPTDGDIFVPHGLVTVLGTTSAPALRPDDTVPRTEEILALLRIGQELFEDLPHYRLLRAFAGTRPLYSADPAAAGRAATRSFAIIDHSREGVQGFASIVGGKLTTYRLMAEKMTDFICGRLGVSAECRTATEPLVEDPPAGLLTEARQYFPACGAELAAERLGPDFTTVLDCLRGQPEKRQLVCECELVTLGEIEAIAADATTFSLDDIRRRTRMGMGTCQGTFCALRGAGVVAANRLVAGKNMTELLREFIEARWSGIRPLLWGNQLREAELTRGIYAATINIDGAMKYERE